MAQDPLAPKDDGTIGLAPPTAGSNKLPPADRPPNSKGKDDKPPRPDGDEAILARMRKRFEMAQEAEKANRKAGIDDLKFRQGEQWDANVVAARGDRPTLTANRLDTLCHQVTNPQRENRPAIRISPIGDRGDPEAAKALMGIIRHLQRECAADVAYDTGFNSSVTNGWGYWVVDREYVAEKSFDQKIVVRRVRNPFSIYLDPKNQEPDGADARWGFEAEMMPRDEYEANFPSAQPVPWAQAAQGDTTYKGWMEKDSIRIVRYWEYETDTRVLVGLSNGHVGWRDELSEDILDEIAGGRIKVLNERDSDVRKVVVRKANAYQVLETIDWPGAYIPIVKVIGDEIDIEGRVTYSGVVRNAKTSQRMYNSMLSALMESIMMQPKAKWLLAEGQDEGYEHLWDNSNRIPTMALRYRLVDLNGQMAPPPTYVAPAPVPAAVMAALQVNAQDLQATTGIRFDATVTERLNDESGRAINELRRNTDIGAFHFVDNLSRSLMWTGRIYLDLIIKTYDTKRVAMILREDDTVEEALIDPSATKPMSEEKNPATGKIRKVLNPRIGEYGVSVTTGPSYETRRIEAAESLLKFAHAMPNTAEYIADIIAKYQDWEGGSEIAARLSKVIAMKAPMLMTPDIRDTPPQVQALLASMDAQIKQMTQQLVAAAKELNDKRFDQQLELKKIEQDFEARILNVVAKLETSKSTHAGSQLADVVGAVEKLMHMAGEHPDQTMEAFKAISGHTLQANAQERAAQKPEGGE